MAVSPAEILADVAPESVPNEQPPEAANYTEADMQGMSCAFCSKFAYTGQTEASDGTEIPGGVCNQWEANVDGVHICDRFASGLPTFDSDGNENWEFADKDHRQMTEVYFSGATAEAIEPDTENDSETGSIFVKKEILRTGEWPVIPVKGGIVKKPLKVVRDGKSNAAEGTIAMEELVENFKAGAIPNPQIPLSDDETEDHKNETRLNTGFIRDLWIEDQGDGSKLVAKMEFTEREVGEKVLRGTYADVSCGIPWAVRTRGQDFGSCLEHTCITNRPFIDGLGPFLAASNAQIGEVEVHHFGDFSAKPELAPLTLTAEQTKERINAGLGAQLNLMAHYVVEDIDFNERHATVVSRFADGLSWTVPFTVQDGEKIALSALSEWTQHEKEEGEQNAPVERKPTAPRHSSDDELEAAYRLREFRTPELSRGPVPTTHEGSNGMTVLSQAELDRLELSDEQRAAFQRVIDENVTLSAKTREKDADKRVEDLKALGLEERPGALKIYRDVMLSDDGGPAVVLLSDSGQKERVGAKELLDRFINALKGPDSEKIELSAQHTQSGNDEKPPAEEADKGNERPLEDRMADAKTAIYGRA